MQPPHFTDEEMDPGSRGGGRGCTRAKYVGEQSQAKQEVRIPGLEAEFPVPPGNLGLLPTATFSLQALRPIPETTRAAQREQQPQIRQAPRVCARVLVSDSLFQSLQWTRMTTYPHGSVLR